MKLKVVTIVAMMFLVFSGVCDCKAYVEFTSTQKIYAETIYQEIKNGYDEYGVLPSTCLIQAMTESGLGEYEPARRHNNLWGMLRSPGELYSYSSITEGIRAYERCINNGWYEGAPFQKDTMTQLSYIIYGGYCQKYEIDGYFKSVYKIISTYDILSYDERLFAEREEERKERERTLIEEQRNAERKAKEDHIRQVEKIVQGRKNYEKYFTLQEFLSASESNIVDDEDYRCFPLYYKREDLEE